MKLLSSILVLAILLAIPVQAADNVRAPAAAGSTVTLEGSIESFASAAGAGPRSLALRDGKGRLHTVWLSPRRLVERERLELSTGHLVRIQGTDCRRGFVAQRLEDRTTGRTVTLREADGTPCSGANLRRAWRAGRGYGYGYGYGHGCRASSCRYRGCGRS
jgi:hypothetical protein